jgi:alpha-galactosidase
VIRHLRSAGVSVLVDISGPQQPEIVYWGADLGELTDAATDAAAVGLVGAVPQAVQDVPVRRGLLPEATAGYRGRPGLSSFRLGQAVWPSLRLVSVRPLDAVAGDGVAISCEDGDAGLAVGSELVLDGSGVLHVRHEVTNTSDRPLELSQLHVVLPVPAAAQEIEDFTGKWSSERAPQRLPLRFGCWSRENRRGRTAADSAYLTMAGTPGFRHRAGRLWAVHLAWSGDQVNWVEAHPDGTRVLGAGELLQPGEITLEPGESYRTPWVLAVHSVDGTDGLSRRLHRSIRSRPTHPSTPRPVVLNTWEAVYFNHDLDTLTRLAEIAAELGVERFVLDDGWFGGRRDDTTSLGDWTESAEVWPDGLGPLVERVTALGMEFGLWVEPEMVNPDSDLYRAHPEWVLADPARLPPVARHQLVLDVARPEVSDYLFDHLDRLVKTYRIGYLKWDHNRDPVIPVHGGRPGVHYQTLAVYALLDRLRAANPGLEIESCASGGARVDLGILERTDRVWVSDCNDALERQHIQQGTRALLPLELMGCHVGPPRSHTTSRSHDLSFRVATALFGHFGIEWDIASASAQDRSGLAAAIELYKELRPLLHTGELITVDHPDPSVTAYGVVSGDRRHAVFTVAQLTMSRYEAPVPVVFPGLDPDRLYRVEFRAPGGPPALRQRRPPVWTGSDPAILHGSVLRQVGLSMPVLEPEQALLIEFTAVGQ